MPRWFGLLVAFMAVDLAMADLVAVAALTDFVHRHMRVEAWAPSRDTHRRSDAESETALADRLGALEKRVAALELEAHALEAYRAREIEPVVSFIRRHHRSRLDGADPNIERIVLALDREGRRRGIDPRLLAAIVLVENPWLDPAVRSPVGAVGIMQVMPFHAGSWGCERSDLTDVETNICHGTEILANALRRSRGDLRTALLRYNGCRHGANTPDCHDYPDHVYGYAGAAWMEEIRRDTRSVGRLVGQGVGMVDAGERRRTSAGNPREVPDEGRATATGTEISGRSRRY